MDNEQWAYSIVYSFNKHYDKKGNTLIILSPKGLFGIQTHSKLSISALKIYYFYSIGDYTSTYIKSMSKLLKTSCL